MADKILHKENKVLRTSLTERIVHWTIAISTFVLIFSGFGQMPMYKRFGITGLPYMAWTGDYHLTLMMHYSAAVVFLFAGIYHLVYHGIRREFGILPRKGDLKESIKVIFAMVGIGKEPPSDKYLPEQRLAYAFLATNLVVVGITGFIKVLKNLETIAFSNTLMIWVTNIHNLATLLIVFGIIGHLGAFIFKANRALLPAMFSGKVCANYCRHRHSIWYARLLGDKCDCFSGKSEDKQAAA